MATINIRVPSKEDPQGEEVEMAVGRRRTAGAAPQSKSDQDRAAREARVAGTTSLTGVEPRTDAAAVAAGKQAELDGTAPHDLGARQQLKLLERDVHALVKDARNTVGEIAEKLDRIRALKFYTVSHGTFDAYCKATFGFTSQWANTLRRGEKQKALQSGIQTESDGFRSVEDSATSPEAVSTVSTTPEEGVPESFPKDPGKVFADQTEPFEKDAPSPPPPVADTPAVEQARPLGGWVVATLQELTMWANGATKQEYAALPAIGESLTTLVDAMAELGWRMR